MSTAAYPASVVSVLGNTLPWTLALVGSATIISFLLGTLLGILAGWRRGGRFDQLLPAFTFLQATPYFFLALIVIQLFANDWHLFPGYGGAEAKGLSTRRVMFTYAARNAILPNIAGFALAIGFVVAGALVMEIVFSYPGVGYLLYTSVGQDDFPVMQGIFLAISATVLLACLLADVIYVIADPRTRRRAAF